MRTIGIIGTGALGQHLAKMLLLRPKLPHLTCQPLLSPINVIGSVRDPIREKFLQHCFGSSLTLVNDNREVARKSDVIILSVKPGQIKDVCTEIAPCLNAATPIISAAAAVPLSRLHEWLPQTKTVIRCMPNIPCSIGSGLVVYFSYTPTAEEIMKDVFSPNQTLVVSSDAEMDASTLIAGCGPALIAWYVETFKKVGEKVIPSDALNAMIVQTMIGTANMLKTQTTNQIIKAVASPKGATEIILSNLNANQIDEEIHVALITAQRRIETIASSL